MKDLFDNFEIAELGRNVSISGSARIQGLNGKGKRLKIGDNTFIGDRVVIMCDDFQIGDYGKIHHDTNIHGKSSCKIGHNFWCGQFTIIDATDTVTIGNNVGVGAHSQLWTHIKYGDTLAGCQWNKAKPLTLMDDVWIVGHCIVSPITAKPKSMALVGSVVTKDMEENQVYAGVPAQRTGTLQFIHIPDQDKMAAMRALLCNFAEKWFKDSVYDFIRVEERPLPEHLSSTVIYFYPILRTYTKRGTDIERDFIKYLLPDKAKFIPHMS